MNRPVFLGFKGFNLVLSVNHKAQGNRLHTARRTASGELSPEDDKRLFKKFGGKELLDTTEADEILDCMVNKRVTASSKSIAINWLKAEA